MGKIHAEDKDSPSLSYYFTICSNITGNVCTATDPGVGCAQQWTDDSCTHWLGEWNNDEAIVEVANKTDPDQGIIIRFANGEECYKKHNDIYPYQAEFTFICDKTTKFTALPVSQDTINQCVYEFLIRSYFACPGFIPNGDDNSDGFSMGFIAIILFFSAIFLGLVLYYVILGIKSKNWGKQSLAPPFNLCKYFWIYVIVGCKTSIIWTRNKISRNEGAGSGSLNDENLIDTD